MQTNDPPKLISEYQVCETEGYPTYDTGLTHSHGSCGSSLFQIHTETTGVPSRGQRPSTGPTWQMVNSTEIQEEMIEGSNHHFEHLLSQCVCLNKCERRQQLRTVTFPLAVTHPLSKFQEKDTRQADLRPIFQFSINPLKKGPALCTIFHSRSQGSLHGRC